MAVAHIALRGTAAEGAAAHRRIHRGDAEEGGRPRHQRDGFATATRRWGKRQRTRRSRRTRGRTPGLRRRLRSRRGRTPAGAMQRTPICCSINVALQTNGDLLQFSRGASSTPPFGFAFPQLTASLRLGYSKGCPKTAANRRSFLNPTPRASPAAAGGRTRRRGPAAHRRVRQNDAAAAGAEPAFAR